MLVGEFMRFVPSHCSLTTSAAVGVTVIRATDASIASEVVAGLELGLGMGLSH